MLAAPVYAQYVEFADDNFRLTLIQQGRDLDGDGLISYAEAAAVTVLHGGSYPISDYSGLEFFTNLQRLDVTMSSASTIDLSPLVNLRYFYSDYSALASITVGDKPYLVEIWMMDNPISALDLSGAPQLAMLDLCLNYITELDLSNQAHLSTLFLTDTRISNVDLRPCGELNMVDLRWNDYLTEVCVDSVPPAFSYMIDDESLFHVCGGTAEASETPMRFALHNAYPNPFNPTTTISYSLAESGVAELALFNLSGRLVSVLHSGLTEAGEHSLQFDGSALSSGVYLLRLTSESEQAVSRITLIK